MTLGITNSKVHHMCDTNMYIPESQIKLHFLLYAIQPFNINGLQKSEIYRNISEKLEYFTR